MSRWRYEVIKKNCHIFYKPKYIQFTTDSVIGAGGTPQVWQDITSEIPTLFVEGAYSFEAKGLTYGNKSYDSDLSVGWFFPAERLGRMFPRHKKQITYRRS